MLIKKKPKKNFNNNIYLQYEREELIQKEKKRQLDSGIASGHGGHYSE